MAAAAANRIKTAMNTTGLSQHSISSSRLMNEYGMGNNTGSFRDTESKVSALVLSKIKSTSNVEFG